MNRKLKAIIIDDERKAREVLSILLERNCPNVEVLEQCSDVLTGIEAIKKHRPDVVFLDVQMPEYAGFEIVNFVDDIDFEIVFVTAFNEYALKAFELSAVDYLTKPVNRERLKEAVQKVQEKKIQESNLIAYQTLLDNLKDAKNPTVIIKDVVGKHIIKLEEIVSVEGQRAYSQIILTSGKRLMVSKNLKQMENLFSVYQALFRCHKSWIINTNYIEKIIYSEGKVVLSGGRIVRVSSSKTKELLALV